MCATKLKEDPRLKIDWRFKKALKNQGITLQVLQGLTGINQSRLSLYANGKYNFHYSEKCRIAKALKLRVDEVFTY